MKIIEGPMCFEVMRLPTEDDVKEEYEKLKSALAGRPLTPALQSYIFDELVRAMKRKISISSTRLPQGIEQE